MTAPPDLARLLESGPALRTVWTVAVWTPDPGETHQAKLGEAGTGFSHPKIQNPESGIQDAAGGSEGEGTGAREVGSRASERLELCVECSVKTGRLQVTGSGSKFGCKLCVAGAPASGNSIWLQRYAKRFAKAYTTRTPSPREHRCPEGTKRMNKQRKLHGNPAKARSC